MVVPKVAEAVNNAPEYAPIRRAFLARVLAQWVRKRHQEGHPTSFDDLLDSGDLGPAKLQGGWRPKRCSTATSVDPGRRVHLPPDPRERLH